MFDIEISRTWYLFSGPVYVSVFVIVSVTCYLRHSVTMIWCLRLYVTDLKFFREVISNQVQMVPGGWHEVYIR